MKKVFMLLMAMLFIICCFGCGSKGIKAPKSGDSYVGVDCEKVQDEFEKAGFENVSTEAIKDIDAQSTLQVGSVESVSINDETGYSCDTEYEKDAAVVITYHTLAEYKANIHVNFIGNLLFSKYDVNLKVDEDTKAILEHGEDLDIQMDLQMGEHKLTFANAEDSTVKGEVKLDVTSDLEAAYRISCDSEKVSVKEEYIDYKVELSEGQVKFAKSYDDYYGSNYKAVVEELQSMGFTNIKTEPLYDIVFGVTDDGELESVTIDGQEGFKRGEVYSNNTEIIVTYHTLEENDPAVIAQKQKEEEERKAEEARLAEETKKAEEARLAEEEAKKAEEEARRLEEENQTLTVENCEELRQLLSMKNTSCPEYEEFASKYAGRKIEFDGRIDSLANHGSFDTRWDILVSAGDYDPDHQSGPNFKFEDVGFYDLHTDLEEIYTGLNVHIIATVDEFDSYHELFFLDPVEITGR